jgi:hypothetical protein
MLWSRLKVRSELVVPQRTPKSEDGAISLFRRLKGSEPITFLAQQESKRSFSSIDATVEGVPAGSRAMATIAQARGETGGFLEGDTYALLDFLWFSKLWGCSAFSFFHTHLYRPAQ